MRGTSTTFGQRLDVADNQTLAPVLIGGVPGLGGLTATCNDQNPTAGVEDPAHDGHVREPLGRAGQPLAASATPATVTALPNGVQTGLVVNGSNTFDDAHRAARATNYAVNGVVRQDGRNTAARSTSSTATR